MISLLDNVSATLIYGVLAVVLIGLQLRTQQSAMDQSVLYMSKKQTLDFAEVLELDVKRIGAGVSGDMIESIATDGNGNTTSFVFNTSDVAGNPVQVAYALEAAGLLPGSSVQGSSSTVPSTTMYRVVRSENGVAAGGSPSTLLNFTVELLSDGGGIATPATARLVRVSFVNAYPVRRPTDGEPHRTYWGVTLRPINLGT